VDSPVHPAAAHEAGIGGVNNDIHLKPGYIIPDKLDSFHYLLFYTRYYTTKLQNTVVWWGENFLWLTGSCFYVWPIILFFLVPLRKKILDKEYRINIPLSILYFILGLLAGLSYENAAAALFFLLIVYVVAKVLHKETFALFELLGLAGFLAGFIILITAPGNYARLDSYELVQKYGFFTRLLIRTFYTTSIFIQHGLLLAGLSVIAGFELLVYQKKTVNIFSFLYLLAGIVGAYSMILSPVFIERVFFPITIFLITALPSTNTLPRTW
jgi:hypothetical protein